MCCCRCPPAKSISLAKDLAESGCKAAGIDYEACRVLATLKGERSS